MTDLIYLNGDFVPFADAKVHVLAPVVKYGALVFEGICAYWNQEKKQSYIFRNIQHLKRLQDSMRILRFDAHYEIDVLNEVVRKTIELNDLRRGLSHVRRLA
jgi:branched-chain amino acid aminotransferase